MFFLVKLIKVPSIDLLSGWDVFELMVNARHIKGDFWIYEGDVEALCVDDIETICEGETEGHGSMSDERFIKHCEDIFDVSFKDSSPSWEMLKNSLR